MIVEIAGRPAAHVKETLEKHVGALEKVKDIEVQSINVSEPKEMENPNKEVEPVFSCFAEVDFEIGDFGRLTETVFDFMPSSIEIIEPSKLNISAQEATSLMNSISGKLHKYDEVARVAQFRSQQMAVTMQSMQEQLAEKDSKKVEKKTAKKKVAKKKKD